jgi:hypothetical protein
MQQQRAYSVPCKVQEVEVDRRVTYSLEASSPDTFLNMTQPNAPLPSTFGFLQGSKSQGYTCMVCMQVVVK